ncbi:TlpA family protein disulfide reductase [Parapedobacter sp. SGR-10]|uniref:TlpA family protein disulfide reductase n=1 Tax=Parapedobacter sp. SGR-10 TaxID=2710879 RepID=UPI0013D5AA44|nr:TlpA disulfide reductase family protein [Parapedobacter sp. SGR-10]NGF56529.1 TlpA family protein disulfide reductase [Parapedobacter sp. SGR-10]
MKAITNIIAVFLLCLLSMANVCTAQTNELGIGDKIPEQLWQELNLDSKEGSKPTIINFWATWCLPCIKELKLLDSILKETDRINIVSVTYEDAQKVEAFLGRNEDLKGGRLKFVTMDTSWIKYFPHRILPHNVWIDAAGTVQYITGGDYMGRDNILAFIERKPLRVKNKNDITNFDVFKPFHMSDSEFEYRSIVTKRIDGIVSGHTVQPAGGYADKQKIVRVFHYNDLLSSMLWMAVGRGRSSKDHYGRMRIVTRDSLRFFNSSMAPMSFKRSKYNSRDELRAENNHCYELRMPRPVKDTLFYAYMLDDLKRIFDLEVEVVEDSILCSIITADDMSMPRQDENDSTVLKLDENGLVAKNVSVLFLLEYLNEQLKENIRAKPADPPFIDRTGGMRISIDLDFRQRKLTYGEIKKLIEVKHGIHVRQQRDRYKITIIKDMS